MIIQAELKCKQTGCEADPCAVDKVIELPSPRFRQFSRALLADYDFIADNKNAVRHDEAARHCLLILDAEGKDGFLVDPQGHNYARYSAFVPNVRSLLMPDMAIDRSYLSPAEPWRDENRDEMLRVTLRVEGKPDYTLVLPADEEYLDAVKTYLDIDVFADAMLCDIRFKVPYIGELIRDTDCPAVEDYNDFAEALEDIWQQDGMLLTYAAVLDAEKPETLHRACELLRNLDNYQRIVEVFMNIPSGFFLRRMFGPGLHRTVYAVTAVRTIITVVAVFAASIIITILATFQVYSVKHQVHTGQLVFIMQGINQLEVTLERIVATTHHQRGIGQTSQQKRIAHETYRRRVHDNKVVPFTEPCKSIIQTGRRNQFTRIGRNQAGRQHIQSAMHTGGEYLFAQELVGRIT